MKYSLPKKIIYSIIVVVLLVGLVLTAFFGLNGKGYGSTYDIDLGLDLARARLIVIHHDARILGFEGFLDGDELLFLQGGIQHHGSARFGHGRGGGENQHAREQESYQFLHRFEPPILFLTSTRNEPLPMPLNAGYGRIASPPCSFFVSLL